MWYNLEYGYDINNNITRLVYRMPQRSVLNKYTYGKDNLLTKYEINDARAVSYTYDALNRLTKTSLSTDTAVDTTYTYWDSERGSGYTTTKLTTETIGGKTYKYYYDTLGNITEIKDGNNNSLYYYEYDAMNQLTYVHDYEKSKVYSYTYDTGGNIIAESISNIGSNGIPSNTKTIFYSYGDENWGDKLTAYDGETITYDAIGNPLSYRDGITMTWKNGRQLATLQNGTSNVQYSYDSDSVRVSKTVNGVKHTYAYINGMLMYETRGDAKFYYSYDANGILYSVKYTLTDSSDLMTYYYTHNSRGDIVGIYNGAGQLRAQYEYDSWGNVQSITDQNGNAITSETHIGNLNPFRYRGYYYDTESGFYYLMSRYYDPVTHRFINADGCFQSGGSILDTNMSAYCRNNPVNSYDPTGTTTWREVQKLLVSGKATNFTINDVTIAQKMGYGPNDYVPFLSLKNTIPVGLGTVKTASYKGWTWRIDINQYSQKHIHIQKFAQQYSQNIDGSPHDGSSGSPPNSVKKYLKEKGIWDWDANEQNYNNSVKKNKYVQVYSDSGEILYMPKSLINPQNSTNLYVMPMDTCFTGITVPSTQFNFYFSGGAYWSPSYIL